MHQGKLARQRDFEDCAARPESAIIGRAVQISVETLYQRRLRVRTVRIVETGQSSKRLRGRRNCRRSTKQSREAHSLPSAKRIHNLIFPDRLLFDLEPVWPHFLIPYSSNGQRTLRQ